jgi:hypothetical protein
MEMRTLVMAIKVLPFGVSRGGALPRRLQLRHCNKFPPRA